MRRRCASSRTTFATAPSCFPLHAECRFAKPLDRQLILDVNAAFEHLSGIPRRDAVGRTTNELGVWEDPAMSAAVLELTRRQAAVTDEPFRFRARDGTVAHARVSGRPITLSAIPVAGKDELAVRYALFRRLGEEAHRLHACRAPGRIEGLCGRWFVGRPDQDFCSRKCRSLAGTRKLRARRRSAPSTK